MSGSKVSARLREPVAPELLKYVNGPRVAEFPILFDWLGDVNKAHVVMLAEQGLLTPARAGVLARGILAIEAAGQASVELDAAREDPYFNYEAHLIEMIGDEAGGRMHIGRSRNDIGATFDRLRVRALLLDVLDAVIKVRTTALEQAERYAEVVMPGYTHLQPAQPMTYGFYLAGVAQALDRDTQRLIAALERMNCSPLGAAAFGGTPFPIDRQRTAELLGFDTYVNNTLDAVASRDFVLEAMSAMSLLSLLWSRVAQDFYVWVTHEFGLFDFPDSISVTSSIMPQKKNPVILEHLKGRCGHVVGTLVAAAIGTKGTHFAHNGESGRAAIAGFWDMTRDVLGCLDVFDLVLRSAQPMVENANRQAAEDFSTATALADLMVRDYDLSFRVSHHLVGAVVRDALDRGIFANDITVDMIETAAVDQLGRRLNIDAAAVRACLNPPENVVGRISTGGPSPNDVKAQITESWKHLEAAKATVDGWRRRIAKSHASLQIAIHELAREND